mgnify:CR=1 FL=1
MLVLLKAKKKPLDTLTPADLNVDISPRYKTLSVSEPAKRKAGTKVETVQQTHDSVHFNDRTARYGLAADGLRSPVRGLIGIPTQTTDTGSRRPAPPYRWSQPNAQRRY